MEEVVSYTALFCVFALHEIKTKMAMYEFTDQEVCL